MPNPTKAFATPSGQPTRRVAMTDAETAARRAKEAVANERSVIVAVDDGLHPASTETIVLQRAPDAADLASVKTRIAARSGVDPSKVAVRRK